MDPYGILRLYGLSSMIIIVNSSKGVEQRGCYRGNIRETSSIDIVGISHDFTNHKFGILNGEFALVMDVFW